VTEKQPFVTYAFFLAIFSVFVVASVNVFPAVQRMVFFVKPSTGLQGLWAVLTYAFYHTDMTHLVFNLVALIVLGPVVEKRTGSFAFAGYCLMTVVLTAVAASLMAPILPFSVIFITGFTGCILMISILFAAFQPIVHLEAFGLFNISSSVIILIFGAFSFVWMMIDTITGFFHIFHVFGYVSAALILAIFYGKNVFKVLFPPRR
jgi:membrane associated rhomboid family serine protease